MLKWWIFLSILALVIDAITSNFFFVGFTIGGFVAIGAYFFGYAPMVQAIIFCIISILSMIIIIPYGRRARKRGASETASLQSRLIGRILVLDQDIEDEVLMKVDGIYWTIKNIDEPMGKGDRAVVVETEGNKLLIKKESGEE
mgnify:CR=1 FL=1